MNKFKMVLGFEHWTIRTDIHTALESHIVKHVNWFSGELSEFTYEVSDSDLLMIRLKFPSINEHIIIL